jgi:hypothetical protein
MNSRLQPQTHPTAGPPATPPFHFGNLFRSFHSFCTMSNKISTLAPSSGRSPSKKTNAFLPVFHSLSFFHSFSGRSNKISPLFSMTSPLFVTLARISPLFAHSSQKHPRGYPLLSRSSKICGTINPLPGSLFARHGLPRVSRGLSNVIISLLRSVPRPAEKPYLQSPHHMAYTRDIWAPRGGKSCNPILLNF